MSINRLLPSIAFSLLLHFIAYVYFNYLLQTYTIPSQEKILNSNSNNLEIKLNLNSQIKFSKQPLKANISEEDSSTQTLLKKHTKEHSERQAQLMIMQLHQLLFRKLNIQQPEPGTCILVETTGDKNQLKCDSPALDEILYKDKKTIADILITLREMGRMFTGFSAETHTGKISINLISNIPVERADATSQNSPNKQ